MPKKWSKHDEAKYEAILDSCKTSNRRKHKKGAKDAATCKRIAAATVNRDRALSEFRGGVPAIPGLFAPPMRGLGAIGVPPHSAYVQLRVGGNVPPIVIITSDRSPTTFRGSRWVRLAEAVSSRSYERARELAEQILRERHADYVPLYRPPPMNMKETTNAVRPL
jgi:hypothetical protein